MASIRITPGVRQVCLHNGKGRPASAIALSRFSSSFARSTSVLTRSGSPLLSQRSQKPSLTSSAFSPRYASTNISTTPSVATSTPNAIPSTTTPDTLATSFDTINAPLSGVQGHVGYLEEMGLDYGWGPTSVTQYMIEHLQDATNLPLWGAAVASVIAVRVVLLPIVFRGSDTAARLATMSPLMKPLQERMRASQMEGDKTAMMQARADLREIMQKANIRYRNLFMPMLFQAPLGYGVFRLTRGMAAVPLPELQSTSIAWLSDLTLADPYMFLPACTSAFIYLTFKLGGENGEQTAQSAKVQKFMRTGFPLLSFLFTAWLPAITQIVFMAGAMWGAFQGYLLRNRALRNLLGIHPFPTKADLQRASKSPGAAPAYTGTLKREGVEQATKSPSQSGIGGAVANLRQGVGGLRKKATDYMDASQKKTSARLTPAEKQRAEKYEAKRRQADKVDLAERLEEERAERMRRLTRRKKE